MAKKKRAPANQAHAIESAAPAAQEKIAELTEQLGKNVSPEVAQAALDAARNDRVRKCGTKIDAALEEFGCALVSVVKLSGNQVASAVEPGKE